MITKKFFHKFPHLKKIGILYILQKSMTFNHKSLKFKNNILIMNI